MDYKVFTTELAGRQLSVEFGKYCQQAAGSAFVRYGDTVVMAPSGKGNALRNASNSSI